MKIVSWNIAGGRTVNSTHHFDYAAEDLRYFVDQLQQINPDVICLQESHTNAERNLAQEIAASLGLSYIFNTPASPSHVDPNFQLSMAIISRNPMSVQQVSLFPNPTFPLYWPDGRVVSTHHNKLLQHVVIDGIHIGNVQLLPATLFGFDYAVGVGAALAHEIEIVLMTIDAPAIVCGDFNFNNPQIIFPELMGKLGCKDALPNEVTRPGTRGEKRTPDHMYHSDKLALRGSGIVQTKTDHYLCWVDLG